MNTAETFWAERAELEREPWRVSGWSERGQTLRFLRCLELAKPRAGEHLLDYGCGTGRLAGFLEKSVAYSGYDRSRAVVERAARERPDVPFYLELPAHPFDVVIACGVWNLAAEQTVADALAELEGLFLATTRRALVASLYRGDDPLCHSFAADELAEFASTVTKRWTLDASHLENDLILGLFR